eukprot:1217283-Rhodomonas_salina.1
MVPERGSGKAKDAQQNVIDRGEHIGGTERELSGEGGCAHLSCHGHLECTVHTHVQCKHDD